MRPETLCKDRDYTPDRISVQSRTVRSGKMQPHHSVSWLPVFQVGLGSRVNGETNWPSSAELQSVEISDWENIKDLEARADKAIMGY